MPTHPFGCKRPIIDQGYYETYNRDNVTLVDLRKGPITAVTPTGIQTEQGFHELDVIVYATGFDAMTGALTRIDVRGRDGVLLKDFWAERGAGLLPRSWRWPGSRTCSSVQGPAHPAAATNFVAALEQHVEWIAACLIHLRANGHRTIEALPTAQSEWIEHTDVARRDRRCSSTRRATPGTTAATCPARSGCTWATSAGIPEYRRRCDEIAAAGYTGFKLS